jgi:hypothetical protein
MAARRLLEKEVLRRGPDECRSEKMLLFGFGVDIRGE